MTFTVLSYQMIKNNWDAEKKHIFLPAPAYFQENSGPCFPQTGTPLDVACQISLLPWRSGLQNNSLRTRENSIYMQQLQKICL